MAPQTKKTRGLLYERSLESARGACYIHSMLRHASEMGKEPSAMKTMMGMMNRCSGEMCGETRITKKYAEKCMMTDGKNYDGQET